MVDNSVLRSEIAKMLASADLNAITSKKVRTELERTLGVRLADRKGEIEEAIRSVLDALASNPPCAAAPPADAADESSMSSADTGTESSLSDLEHSAPDARPKSRQNSQQQQKKRKSGAPQPAARKAATKRQQLPLTDEELARQLHATENGLSRRRAAAATTSGSAGGGRRKSGGGGGGAFSKPCALSPELASVLGCDSMPRQEVVKRLWDMAKERNLFDPKNKQFVVCDAQFEKLFNRKRLRMFAIMKYLKNHVISN